MMQDADNTIYSSRERRPKGGEKVFFFKHLIFSCLAIKY